jgi:Tol biopolymer transport system component
VRPGLLGLFVSILSGCAGLPPAEPVGEARLLSNIRQVTFVGRRSGEGYFSPDGSSLALMSEREPGNPFFQIYRMDLRSGEVTRVSRGVGKTTCPWIHPDGERVLFASTHHDPNSEEKQRAEFRDRAANPHRRYSWDFDPEFEIYDGERNLTRSRGYDAECSWSPDGSKIVFASNRHAPPNAPDPGREVEIYLMDADGSNVRRLTYSKGYDGGPFFSPDGSRICWRRFSEEGTTAEIFTMNLEGRDVRQLTRLAAMSWAPFYHPSGEYLIFSTNLHGFGNFELYLVDVEGRSSARVTFREGFDGLPAFSPDGRTLAWTSNRGGSSQIYFADWDDSEARRLLGLAPGLAPQARTPPEPGTRLRAHVAALTAPEMEGRRTGSDGERRAAEYVARAFEAAGLEPAGDGGGWLQDFGQGRNVLGRLRGEGEGTVVVGAHLDHLGPGYPGADDNASGVAALIEIARQIPRRGLRRTILFAAWSGEEVGLLGSRTFAARAKDVAAVLNMDMVGRLDRALILQGVGSSPSWLAEIERANAPVGLPISLSEESRLPTDTTSFHLKGIPALNAFTGAHLDYHQPSDTADKLNYAGIDRIARLMARLAHHLASSDRPVEFRRSEPAETPPRAELRAWLGTVPDYAATGDGLRLSGVMPGGPAEKAGLREGDVIVQVAGRSVKDIYDYTRAIEGLKSGTAIDVIVLRDGARLTLSVTPAAR